MAVKIVPKEEMLDAIGTKFEPGEWIEVTQDRINVFADCTEDHQFIHVDEEAAKNTPFCLKWPKVTALSLRTSSWASTMALTRCVFCRQ
jgi:acyl dehydratase